MPEDKGDTVVRPDFKTRFTSKTAPRQGRPPGYPNKRKLQKAVDERLDEMLDHAATNVENALRAGCKKTSIWFIEHMRRERGTRVERGLLSKLGDALDRVEDIERVSRRAVLLAIDGDMTFEELTAIQAALSRHSTLAGMVELKTLREELAQLRGEMTGDAAGPGMSHAPAWGRIVERTAQPPEEEAEAVPETKRRKRGKKANGAAKK